MIMFVDLSFHHMGYVLWFMLICVPSVAFVIYTYNTKRSGSFLESVQAVPALQEKPTNTDYTKAFPPSRRSTLKTVLPEIKESLTTPDLASSPQSLVKLESNYRTVDPSLSVFSGFTISDIKVLGDFADYATLSGVPLPAPMQNFDVDTAAPRPYRPFRWNYHQTMGYYKLDKDYWIELESTYRDRIAQRQKLYAKHGKDVLQALPGSELACKELMEMVLQFLCARYPAQFQLDDHVLANHILGTRTDLSRVEALQVLLNNIPEDFALVLRDEATGRYVFRAGVICSSVGWNLGEKIGADMAAIHGPVPDFKEKLAFSLDRFFTKMEAPKPIQRASWGLEIGQPLYLPADHPEFAHRGSQNPELCAEDIYLRVDWQTLRRLPLSGAVAFNFKALFTPVTQFRDEPYVPSLLLKILSEGKESLMKYKGTWHVEHVAKPVLAEYERLQIEQGMIEKDWEPKTLDEAPFFPGWKEKWLVNGGPGLQK